MNRLFLAVSISFLTTAGFAGSIEDARQAYQSGQYAAALKIAVPAAKGGDPVAQNLVGAAYNDGHGVEQNIATSITWFKKSADQGYVKAMYNLGLAYRNDVSPPNYINAITYFELAMRDEYPSAFTQRGEMYMSGQGSDVLPDRARIVLNRAAALDDADGMAMLGDLYRTGEGGDINLDMARRLYSRAAALGHATAMGNLALMYEMGLGVLEDTTIAYTLYVEAVELGDANSSVNLASFMMEFDGYWTDPSTAYAYCLWAYKLVGDNPPERFDQVCGGIKSQLTDGEFRQANTRFEAW